MPGIHTLETTMHGRFDRSDQTTGKSIIRSWGIGFFALPVLLVAFLVGLAITKPNVSRWISEAAQAEFAGAIDGPASSDGSRKPARKTRTVKAY